MGSRPIAESAGKEVVDTRTFTLDHVELFVPDRTEAAQWYSRVFGCRAVAGTERWAADPGGPLMLSADGGQTKLAFFEGKPQRNQTTAGFHRVAFRVTGSEWLAFVARLPDLGVATDEAVPIFDHGTAWSVYFADPYGHRLEVTTYDADLVRQARGTA
jgi:catechol 2,3-dioxygenase-like lactoylglutathione lyase family enzyme